MSKIQKGKHNYLYYKYIQIDTVSELYFFENCTSYNQLTPLQALEHPKKKSIQLWLHSALLSFWKFNNFTRKKGQEG